MNKKNKMKLFAVISRNLVDKKTIKKAVKDNQDYAKGDDKNSNLIFGAFKALDSGAISLREAESRKEIWDLIKKSPFYQNDFTEYQVFELDSQIYYRKDTGLEYFDKFSTKSDK